MHPRTSKLDELKIANMTSRATIAEARVASLSSCLDNERETNERDREKLRRACSALAYALQTCSHIDRETALRILLGVPGT